MNRLAAALGILLFPLLALAALWLCAQLAGCSAARPHLEPLRDLYAWEQGAAVDGACGGAEPCAAPDEARAAVVILRERWRPAWDAMGVEGERARVEADRAVDVRLVVDKRAGGGP